MKIKTSILSAVAALALGGAANAATITTVTEGDRDQIVGSILAIENGTGTGDTELYDLTGTSLKAGDTLEIHGRIIGISDTYQISSNREFRVQWIFDGYTTDAGFVADSGFVATPTGSAGAAAAITMSDGITTTDGIQNPFTTDIMAANDSNIQIFTSKFAAGTYDLKVDGEGVFPIDSLYDIRITAVPVPAGAVLLLSGLAGLGLARRRRG